MASMHALPRQMERDRFRLTAFVLATELGLGGCATQPPYSTPRIDVPAAWAKARLGATDDDTASVRDDWWTRLHDPAIDALVASALTDNPTLAQAAARVDEARAGLGASRARRAPQLGGDGALSRGKSQSQTGGTDTINATSGSLGASLSWELDLWGRARATEEAARSRLDARDADAQEARLSLVAQIADGVVALRACNYSLAIRDQDISSRETELSLIRQRLAVGNVAPVEEASAVSALASARTTRLSQEETCTTLVDAIVALSGREATTIRQLVSQSPWPSNGASTTSASGGRQEAAAIVPTAPPTRLDLPATVLLQHPTVRSAERELAASYAEVGVARAERLPRVDLSGLLTGQWIRALGSTIHFDTWSAGAAVSVPIFDAGLGAANVDGAQARYRAALAGLAATLRTATRDVEDSLAALSSAEQRADTSRQAVDAAAVALRANEARYRAGAISLFELEGSRRQFNSAQESAIASASDRARSWVSLVRAAGNPPLSVVATEPPMAEDAPHTPSDRPIARIGSHRR